MGRRADRVSIYFHLDLLLNKTLQSQHAFYPNRKMKRPLRLVKRDSFKGVMKLCNKTFFKNTHQDLFLKISTKMYCWCRCSSIRRGFTTLVLCIPSTESLLHLQRFNKWWIWTLPINMWTLYFLIIKDIFPDNVSVLSLLLYLDYTLQPYICWPFPFKDGSGATLSGGTD